MLKIEESLRLDTFHRDCPIVLGNGEPFHFRPPRFVSFPVVSEDGRIETGMDLNYGEEWTERYYRALEDEAAGKDMLENIFWFADTMLMRNYRPEIRRHYRILLYFNSKEPDSARKFMQIWDLARGYDPKGLSSDG